MDTTHLYMFVDYDGVVITFAEGLPIEYNRQKTPFSHSAIRILSCIANQAGIPAYFIPISSSPGNYTKQELKTIFQQVYEVNNLDLHPEEPIAEVRLDRDIYVKNILAKYQPKYYLILDDEFFWYENQELNFFQTHTRDGITHEVFDQMWDFANTIANDNK